MASSRSEATGIRQYNPMQGWLVWHGGCLGPGMPGPYTTPGAA